METEYSADAIAAARSLQIFTVRVSLSWTRVDNDGWDMSHQYIYSACCRNCFLLILTQFSVDGYILGGLVSTYFRTPLNLLLQTYDYACSIHNEVLYLSSVNLAFWWKEYFKVGVPASVTLDQGEGSLYRYAIYSFPPFRQPSISCV